MQQSYPGINPSVSEWRSQEITDFQEELRAKVNAHVSEKWFYNHFKQQNRPLPRIDMLNILSRYAGYINWDDFLYSNKGIYSRFGKVKSANRYFIFIPFLVAVIFLMFIVIFRLVSHREYRFSFYDSITREPIAGNKIEIIVLPEMEPPATYLSDSSGNFNFKTDKRSLKMVVSAPYYKTDTIRRILKTFERDQKISLYPDDFARMILYFSEMNVADWQKRREKLDSMIDKDALIYQTGSGNRQMGVELFSKQEFIDKLTVPASSLRNLEVLETKFRKDKIAILRFRISEKRR